LFIVPLLMLAVVATVEFGAILQVRQSVATAAIEGVRTAAMGGNLNDVTTTVNQIMALHTVVITANSTDANIVLELPNQQPQQLTQFTATGTGPPLVASPAEVRVTVSLSYTPQGMASAWQGGLLPDFLVLFGFPLSGQTFNSSALSVKE
jgi:Flp pilus assembly protein TadG